MAGDGNQNNDAEAGWPAKFDPGFLRGAAAWLLGLLATLLAVLVAVYLVADQFDGADAGRHVVAFALLVVGMVGLVGGMWFALVEAKKPPPPATPGAPPTGALDAAAVDPGSLVSSVAAAFEKRAVSRVLFTIAFVLIVLAAAGSGFIDISVSTGDGAAPATPSPTATP